MQKQRVLTGITTTGTPHLGNYVGAIRPAVEASHDDNVESFYFLADYHALVKNQDPAQMHASAREVAAAWLACGLDTSRVTFYRQSDVPETFELTWMLTCMAAKGLMNRAHAYKAAVQANQESGEDPDFGITMGLYCYPILMAADILLFRTNRVPVGRDQIQHVEMARDIAQRFNHYFGEHMVLPVATVDDHVAVLQGTDGRKMSKSYNNAIPLFLEEKKLRKQVNRILTNLREPGEPKDTEDSAVFQIWRAFATAGQTEEMRREFANGIAWGEAKQRLFELLNSHLAGPRERYNELMADPAQIERELRLGAERARDDAAPYLARLRHAIGMRSLDI